METGHIDTNKNLLLQQLVTLNEQNSILTNRINELQIQLNTITKDNYLQEAKKQTEQLTHISDSLIVIASHLITTQVSSSIVL